MADLDQLQIQITSNASPAADAIDKITASFERLNAQLSKLDVSKVNSFANAVNKISNSNSAIAATNKGLDKLSRSLSKEFGIKSKEGIEAVSDSLKELFAAHKALATGNDSDGSPLAGNTIAAQKNLEDVIKTYFSVKSAVDSTTKSVRDYVKATNKGGTKIDVSDMVSEYGDDFKKMRATLGKAFVADSSGTEFAKYIDDMKSKLGENIFQSSDPREIFKELVGYISGAKDEVLNFNEAVKKGVLSETDVEHAVNATAKELYKLIDLQEQMSTTPGVTNTIDAIAAIGNLQFPDLKGMVDSIKEASKLKDVAPAAEQVAQATEKMAESAQEAAPSIQEVEEKTEELGKSLDDISDVDSFSNLVQETYKAKSAIETAIEKVRELKSTIAGMEKGTIPFDDQGYKSAIQGYNNAKKAVDDFKKSLSSDGKKVTFMKDMLPELIELGEGLEKLAHKFEEISEKGEKLFEFLIKPLEHVAEEYKEKFENMKNTVQDFAKSVQARMAKLSAFWKRTMKTFTFMLVRKAITAIIKEVGNAVQSLAMYSNAMGTAFNTDISNMVADFQYLGRSIVSVFAPLLSYIAPIIDAITDRIATLLSYIGMLFAALGGGTSFTKAKKNVNNYAESLDSASKSAKNLTMGIDELNILSENKGGGGAKPYDGWEDAWEEIEIPRWIRDLGDWFKDLWKKFFDPLKAAWERAKQYLIDGFKTMIDALKRMFGHIIDDFLTMWNQEKTIRMFEQILKIVGDLFRVIRNLANQFDEAWEKGKVGLKIFENLRDILAIIVDHVRNVSYYMIGWAKEIDFYPMLKSFEELTRKMKPLAEFIGGVFEDIMKEGVLKYIEFIIEDAIPHMNETLSSILDSFSFAKLRENLKPVWSAIEEMLEQIHTGVTNTIGNIGRAIGEFTSSNEFEKFLERIVEITKLITAERVEKVLTGLAQGIIDIAKSVVKFVNSKAFLKFLQAIAEWIDKKSVKDIAKILGTIAKVIIGFKFTAFATEKVAGFFKFLTVLTALNNLKTIASELGKVSKEIVGVGEATEKVKITSFAQGFKTLGDNVKTLPAKFLDLHNNIGLVTKTLGGLFVGFEEFKHVQSSVEDLSYSLMSGNGLNGSLLELVATVGIATAAFTALFGFPAGAIAAGVTAVIGAIKGIQGAIDQLNFDTLNNAIITGGDTTFAEAKEWYEQATSIVTEQTQKWVDSSRNITQAGDDIQNYLRTIGELSGVLKGSEEATVLMVDTLTGKYSDLKGAIENYIDESTNSLVANLLAQKSYLEAQGFDVDQMILDIYQTAESTKKAVSEATKAVEETAKKYSEAVEEFGYGSDEAKEALKAYEKATIEAERATGKYNQVLQEVTTDEAVKEIQELGNSLDLSEYAGNPEGAITAIETNIDELKAKYLEKMAELRQARDDEIKAINAHPDWPQEMKDANIASVQETFAEMSDTLSTETGKVFDLYQNTIAEKVNEVANQASQTWDEKGGIIFGYKTKADYIHSQVTDFVGSMLGEDGMEGTIKKYYDAMPGNVNSNIVTAIDGIVDETWQEYSDYTSTNGIYKNAQGIQLDYYQELVNQVNNVDFDTPASTFNTESWGKIVGYAKGLQYDEFGKVVIGGASESIIDSKQNFEDAMRLVSGEGANAFSDEHKKEIQPLADAMSTLGIESGKNFDLSFVDSIRGNDVAKQLEEGSKPWGLGITTGLNSGIEEGAETTKPCILEWFRNINTWIHDNPDMPFGSPNQKTIEYGEDLVNGLNKGIENKIADGSVGRAVINLFTKINTVIKQQMEVVKTNLSTALNTTISGLDVTTPIASIFTKVTTVVTNNLNILGANLQSNLLPTFMQTYIFPFFNVDMWQPLFDNLFNIVFVPMFEQFRTWFSESMTAWWEEDLLIWFDEGKWDEDIFTPLRESFQDHWDTFSSWWDTTMNEWWENQVKPWFAKELWKEQLTHILDVTKEVFDLIKEAIQIRINEAGEAVAAACETMMQAIEDVMNAIDDMMGKLGSFEGFEGKITFDFGADKFATGGFPSKGSLFWASETGAGAEMVGTVGGKTGVVSNGEITGIADAIYSTGGTESQLLAQLIQIGQAMLNKDPIVLSDKDIARMNNSGQNKLGMSIIS